MSEQKEQTANMKTLQDLKEGVQIKVHNEGGQITIKIGSYKIDLAPKDNWFSVQHESFKNSFWGMFYKDGSGKEKISITSFSEKIEVNKIDKNYKNDNVKFIGYRFGE